MNWYLIVAGLLAAFTSVGHFIIGSRQFLAPMLDASFDGVARKQMYSVFHYVSVDLVLSAALLLGPTTRMRRFPRKGKMIYQLRPRFITEPLAILHLLSRQRPKQLL